MGQLGVHTQAVMSMLMIRAAFADPPWVAQQPQHPWILFGADFQEQSKSFFREHFPVSMLWHILANTANRDSDVRRVKYDCNDDKIQKGQNKSFWQVGNGRQLCLKCAERRELVGQQMIGEKHFFAALLLVTILFAICPNTCGHACWVQGCSISIFPQTQICFSIVGDSSSNIEFHIAIICRSHVHVQLCALCT